MVRTVGFGFNLGCSMEATYWLNYENLLSETRDEGKAVPGGKFNPALGAGNIPLGGRQA